jgi:hypothetical protein
MSDAGRGKRKPAKKGPLRQSAVAKAGVGIQKVGPFRSGDNVEVETEAHAKAQGFGEVLEVVSKHPLEQNFGVAELDRGSPSPRIQRQMHTYTRYAPLFRSARALNFGPIEGFETTSGYYA